MVKFSGTVSEECKKYILKRESRAISFSCIIVSMIGAVVAIVLALTLSKYILMFLFPLALLAILGSLPDKKGIGKRLPLSITIDKENDEVLLEAQSLSESYQISDVKKIIDAGEWYDLRFTFPHKLVYFVCQKNLLTEGTIEEFEEIFAGLIIRKGKD